MKSNKITFRGAVPYDTPILRYLPNKAGSNGFMQIRLSNDTSGEYLADFANLLAKHKRFKALNNSNVLVDLLTGKSEYGQHTAIFGLNSKVLNVEEKNAEIFSFLAKVMKNIQGGNHDAKYKKVATYFLEQIQMAIESLYSVEEKSAGKLLAEFRQTSIKY